MLHPVLEQVTAAIDDGRDMGIVQCQADIVIERVGIAKSKEALADLE